MYYKNGVWCHTFVFSKQVDSCASCDQASEFVEVCVLCVFNYPVCPHSFIQTK